MNSLHVLLPAFARCGQASIFRNWLIRGDRLPDADRGHAVAVAECFSTAEHGIAVGALLREAAHGDAGEDTWLCADPAFVQPDMTGARMLACGTLDLGAEQAQALARPLRPVLGDRGFLLELSQPDHWHVRLPRDARVPDLASPEAVLGDDLLAHLPEGPDSAPWRSLLNEIQILLHNHPVNAERRAQGQPPVNCLWFWGAGRLPMWVRTPFARVYSDDPLVRILARRAGIADHPRDDFEPAGEGQTLLDLESMVDPERWWPRLAYALKRHKTMRMAFASGERMQVRSWHRWRLWRRVA